MKTLAALAIAASLTLLANKAAAETPATDAVREPLVVTDEAGDAWLHDHCAYRGMVNRAIANLDVPGQVVELVSDPIAKEFRCAERPPFWQGSWSPASPDTVSCTAPGTPRLCVTPLGASVATAVAVALPAQPAAAAPTAAKAGPVAAPTSGGPSVGWVLIGVGVVGLATSAMAGVVVLESKSTAASHCDAFDTCDASGLAAAQRGKTASVVGTVAFAAGAAALTGGIVLLTIAKPREKQVKVVARPSTAGASFGLEGRF